ncbi:DNA-binding protein [Pseudoduganella sp. GCM10020061]|uniref:DNA-binding protein n=1 Tax=Pseudoduganella sp. GCM10020061 TaxID=3317345 RepID=UPI00362E3E61
MLTYEQVITSVDSLRAQGIKPTVDRVWKDLGNVGSKGTVHKLVKRYLAELDETQKPPQSLRMLPLEIKASIFAFADQSASTAREAVAHELLEAKQEAATLAEESIRLDAELAYLRAQLAQTDADRATISGRALQLEAELAAARAERVAERALLDQARNELARAEQQLQAATALEEELRDLRAERDIRRDACVDAERKSAVLEVKHAQAEAQLAEKKDLLARMHESCARLEERNRELQEDLDSERQKTAALERDLAVQMALEENRARVTTGAKKRQFKQVDMFADTSGPALEVTMND